MLIATLTTDKDMKRSKTGRNDGNAWNCTKKKYYDVSKSPILISLRC
jgi:hypothetical protein